MTIGLAMFIVSSNKRYHPLLIDEAIQRISDSLFPLTKGAYDVDGIRSNATGKGEWRFD